MGCTVHFRGTLHLEVQHLGQQDLVEWQLWFWQQCPLMRVLSRQRSAWPQIGVESLGVHLDL